MIEYLKRWILTDDIENRLFSVSLLFAPAYFGLNIVFDIVQSLPPYHLVLDITFLFVSVIFFFLRGFFNNRSGIIFIFSILLMLGLLYFWYVSGGIQGSGAYIFPVLAVLVIFINKGRNLQILSLALFILTFVLAYTPIPVFKNLIYAQLMFEYVINLSLLTILLVIFKLALDKEEVQLEVQNHQLDSLNRSISQNTAELEEYNGEIKLIQENLEYLVDQRSQVLKKENKRDLEYSFINAHLVRAPIANILAIVEQSDSQNPKFIELKKKAEELDGIVRKIGKVLSDN